MTLNELDDYKYPRRRPWLLLVVLLCVALVIWLRSVQKASETPSTAGERPAADAVVADQDDTVAEQPSEPEAPVPADVDGLLAQARALEARDSLVEARNRYLRVLDRAAGGRARREAEAALGKINVALIKTVRPMPEKSDVIVKSGDSLERIARRLGTTVDLIQEANLIRNPNRIRAGDHLRVFTGKFAITASKKRNDMVVTMNGSFFKRYDVGSGLHGKTPVGLFTITEKIKEPVWWRPDGKEIPFGHEENILGTRWMTLRASEGTPDVRGYGIHGTWDEASIGKAESAGCLRMRNRDVEELFLYIPTRTPVTIVE
ncbi:MAG: L,D-transpeptidase family protein [Kiritimatiellia bacterium]|jgi:LysM repeat protein|nr:L,D-transpeptidase family protein [Kiritimatiellia bacterium]MDP6810990.1 L,D-transpeptidase family protein [Kiritimatiellia bacterium]MDP7025211.1 L,D-transpeptidase family protein [Kiritimatiellia bacterium]